MKRAFALGLLLVGCGESSISGTAGGDPGGGGGAGAQGGGGNNTVASTNGGSGGGGAGEPVPGQQSITFGPVNLEPGAENTQCIQVRLGNTEQLRVHEMHNLLSQGSHHLIIYRTTETEEKLTPYNCDPFIDTLDPSKGAPLMVTQKHEETLTLPEGVAFTLEPHQMIRLEVHYFNATSGPIDMTATATFTPIAEKDYKYEADFLFLGNPDVDVAPKSTSKLGPVFLPLGKLISGISEDAKFFALTGHTHKYGTNVSVNLAQNKDDPGTPVYEVADWSWAEPETVKHDPGFSIPPEGGFKFSCEWNNTSDNQLGFGESANDEMCFFWAYYYPSKGAYVCAHTDAYDNPLTQEPYVDLCCPGHPFCGALKDF